MTVIFMVVPNSYQKSTWNVYQVYFSSKTTEASNNLVLYVRLPGEEDCYYPLFLKEKSVMALKLELAIKMNIDPNTIEKILNKRKTTFSGKSNPPKPVQSIWTRIGRFLENSSMKISVQITL